MSYSDLDSQNFYSDDPVECGLEKSKKKSSSRLALVLFAVAGTFFLQNTLAANISLNSGGRVEFGQGIQQTTACSGTTQILMIPNATFTNAAGAGSYKFSSITVSNIPAGCHGSDFTINAYDNANNTPLALFNSTSRSAVIYNNAGTFELGVGSTGMTVASSTGTFTATFTAPVALSSSISKITIQSGAHTAVTCSQGGPCIVGDRGPGGGIIFYVSASNFTSAGSTCNTACKYLEVAPSTWRSGTVADDLQSYAWSTNKTTSTAQNKSTNSSEGFSASEKLNWKIGQGFYNTSVMKVGGATSTAQAAVLAYSGSSTAGQWFIPSMNELNELCKYVRGQITGNPKVACATGGTFKSTANAGTDLGGFVEDSYWSSSEHSASFGWHGYFASSYQGLAEKDVSYATRPVRAF